MAKLMKFTNGVLFWDLSFFRGFHVRDLEIGRASCRERVLYTV